jgi:predicted RNA-binding Zn ribbon-like protein
MMEADLRIVGGHLALDLANTVAPRPPATVEIEFLADDDAVLTWARRVGVINEAEERLIRQAPGVASHVRDVRDLIDPVLAGRDLDRLMRRWAEAMARSTLEPGPNGSARLVIGTEPAWMIGDRLADAVVDLLRHADLSRLRVCPPADGGCGFLFLDRSRNLSRRWCSMEDCGAQAKSRRLTQRRRERR